MSRFKVGDKVLCVSSDGMDHLVIGNEYSVNYVYSDTEISVKEVPNFTHYTKRFELVKEKHMFDMKKDKWFIRTPTPEISEAVQLWLFEQGFKWCSLINKGEVRHTDRKILSGAHHFGSNEFGCNDISDKYYLFDAKEIKVKIRKIVEYRVDTVEYPSTETQAQKDLKELEQQIAKLSEQAAKLRESI